MQTTSRILSLFICTLTVFSLPGCISGSGESYETTTPAPFLKSDDVNSTALVADDFVNALRQIPTLVPASTTVQLLRTQMDDGLIQAFKDSLEHAGYGVRWVGEPSANTLLQYRREDINAIGAPDQVRLDIAVGDVELRRSYTGFLNNLVQPATPLYVRGADATHIVLEDADFFGISRTSAIEAVPLTVPKNINPLSGLVENVSAANSMTIGALASSNSVNVFDLGGSNYANALSEHEIVVEQVLTFPNDSLRMGGTNKQLLNELVTRFDPSTDLFSVIGCSIGPTNLKNGNAALALGRASRVREALLFAGIDPQKILDEGCWAGDSPSITLPRRGVVVTLNRQF